MRYKQLVIRKLDEVSNIIMGHDSLISMLRPPVELKESLSKLRDKLTEIQIMVNIENETL